MVELSSSFTLPPAIRRSFRCGEDDTTAATTEPAGSGPTATATASTTGESQRQQHSQSRSSSSSANGRRTSAPPLPPPYHHQYHHHPHHPAPVAPGTVPPPSFQQQQQQQHPSERVKSFVNGIVSPFTACWQPSLNQCGGGGSSAVGGWNINNSNHNKNSKESGGGGGGGGACAPMNCGGSSPSDVFKKQPAVVISPPHGGGSSSATGGARGGARGERVKSSRDKDLRASPPPAVLPPRPSTASSTTKQQREDSSQTVSSPRQASQGPPHPPPGHHHHHQPPYHHHSSHYSHPYYQHHPHHPYPPPPPPHHHSSSNHHPPPPRHYRDYSQLQSRPNPYHNYEDHGSSSSRSNPHGSHDQYASPVTSPRSNGGGASASPSDRERYEYYNSHHRHYETPVSPVSTEVGTTVSGGGGGGDRNGQAETGTIGNYSISNSASPQQPEQQQATDNIEKPGTNDVICGRGGSSNRHLGNIHFRELVAANKQTYNTLTKKQKMMIARKIVDTIHGTNPPGRFLSKDLDTGLFYDIGLPRSLEKTSQALREKNSNAGTIVSPSDGTETATEPQTPNVDGDDTPNEASKQPSGESPSASIPDSKSQPKRRGRKKVVEAPPLTIPPSLVAIFGSKDTSTLQTEQNSEASKPSAASGQPSNPPENNHSYNSYPPNSPGGPNFGHPHRGYGSYRPPQTVESPRSEASQSSYHMYDSRHTGPPPQYQHDPHYDQRNYANDKNDGTGSGKGAEHTPSSPPPVPPKGSPVQGPSPHAPPSNDHYRSHPGHYYPGGPYPGPHHAYGGQNSPHDRYYYNSPHHPHHHSYYNHHYHPHQHPHPHPSPNAPVLYRTPSNGYVRGTVDVSPERRRDIKRQRSDSFSNHNTSQSFMSSSDVSLSSAVRDSLTLKDQNNEKSQRGSTREGSEAGASSVALSNISGASSTAEAWAARASNGHELKSPAMILQSRGGSRRGMRSILDNRGPSPSSSTTKSSPPSSAASSPGRPTTKNDDHGEEKKEGDLSFSGVSGLAALSAAAFLKLDES